MSSVRATFELRVLREQPIQTNHGPLSSRLYRGSDGSVGMALWTGDLTSEAPLHSRLHSSCFTSEGLAALDCDCFAQLDSAFFAIHTKKRGIIFYLLQEGRGAGLPNKARDRSIVQTSNGRIDTYGAYTSLGLEPDPRRYDIVRPICADLGIRAPLQLMTNNPLKIAALGETGLNVQPVEHELPASTFNSEYLAAKAKSGHSLTVPTVATAMVPPGLDHGDPHMDRVAGYLRAASYGLPVWVGTGPVWLRATSYIHEASGHDRFVLSYRREPGLTELRHVYREELTERMMGRGEISDRYKNALEQIVALGRGSMLAVPSDPKLLTGTPGPNEDEDLALLAAHGAKLGSPSSDAIRVT